MLTLDIVTPEKRVLTETDISIVTVDTVEGQIGILPKHISLYSQLRPSELTYTKDGHEHFLAIHGGFIEVANDTVTILADDAIRAEEIDEATVLAAQRRAEEAMSQKVTDEDYAFAEGAMRKALLELKVVKRKH
jgi:F-type H+-transporting ATPase subunit epsilon